MSAHFDAVVVGAGPGGMAAAVVAAEAGLRVCLLDDNLSPGGQIWRGFRTETAAKYSHGAEFLEWAIRLQRTDCSIWQGWQAVSCPDTGILRLERGRETRTVRFERLILATGARERFLPFPGWTLPGVMGAGGLQALVKGGLEAKRKRVVLAGSGPLLLAVAAGLKSAGAHVAGIYEQASARRLAGFAFSLFGQPGKLAEGALYRLRTLDAPYRTGAWVVAADGRGRVETVTLTDGRRRWNAACDWLGCGFHLVPNLELPRLLGCRVEDGFATVDAMQQSSVAGIACVGELTGIGGLEKAIVEGQIAGWAAARRDGEAAALLPQLKKLKQFARGLERAFELRSELRTLSTAETVVCRCEDVTHAELEVCTGWREAKLHTRCGMGACQGRICGSATEFVYGWENASARPPVFPAAVSTLGADAMFDG